VAPSHLAPVTVDMDFPCEFTSEDPVGLDASRERLERQVERLGSIGRWKLSEKTHDAKFKRRIELIKMSRALHRRWIITLLADIRRRQKTQWVCLPSVAATARDAWRPGSPRSRAVRAPA